MTAWSWSGQRAGQCAARQSMGVGRFERTDGATIHVQLPFHSQSIALCEGRTSPQVSHINWCRTEDRPFFSCHSNLARGSTVERVTGIDLPDRA